LVKPTKSWPRNTPKAITIAGPSHQRFVAKSKDVIVTVIVGPKCDAFASPIINFIEAT
jgi:hypothetical protein